MSIFKRRFYLFYLLLAVGLLPLISAQAQSSHQTAQNLGLGGGGTAYIDDYHANFVNPANLMLSSDSPRITVGLLGGISGSAGGSLLNISVYNEYFTKGLTVSDQVAADALNEWFGGSAGNYRDAGMQLDVIPVGVSYRGERWAAALALRSRVLADASSTRGLAELGVYGLDGNVFSEPKPVNAGLEALSFHEVSLGYGMHLLSIPSLFGFAENIRVYAGAAPKLLLGAHTSRLDFNSTLQIEGESENGFDLVRHDFRYVFETTGAVTDQLNRFYQDRLGQDQVPDIADYVDPKAEDFYKIKTAGWGVDLGGTVEMDIQIPIAGALFEGPERLRVGLSLTDVGRINFKERAGRFSADDMLEWEGFTFDDEVIDNEFNGNRDEYLESVLIDSVGAEIYGSFAPEDIESLSRPLPSRLNLGAQLIMNKLSMSVDFGRGFHSQGVNSRRLSFETGVEYRLIGVIPLRVGMRTGGVASTAYSAGIGLELRNFEFSLAASSVRSSANRGSYGGAAWSGLVFKF